MLRSRIGQRLMAPSALSQAALLHALKLLDTQNSRFREIISRKQLQRLITRDEEVRLLMAISNHKFSNQREEEEEKTEKCRSQQNSKETQEIEKLNLSEVDGIEQGDRKAQSLKQDENQLQQSTDSRVEENKALNQRKPLSWTGLNRILNWFRSEKSSSAQRVALTIIPSLTSILIAWYLNKQSIADLQKKHEQQNKTLREERENLMKISDEKHRKALQELNQEHNKTLSFMVKQFQKERDMYKQLQAEGENNRIEDFFIKKFIHHHDQKASVLMRKAKLGTNNRLDKIQFKRFKKFIQNSEWELARYFKVLENQEYLYFSGDPGIGKSSAFAALICYLQNEQTRPEIIKLFPQLSKYDNFIFINGTFDNLQLSREERNIIFQYIKKKKYLIILDDIHQVQNDQLKKGFLQSLLTSIPSAILLASQSLVIDRTLKMISNLLLWSNFRWLMLSSNFRMPLQSKKLEINFHCSRENILPTDYGTTAVEILENYHCQ